MCVYVRGELVAYKSAYLFFREEKFYQEPAIKLFIIFLTMTIFFFYIQERNKS